MRARVDLLTVALSFLGTAPAVLASPPESGLLYRIDPDQAQVSFDLRATGHTVHGYTERVSGEARVLESEDAGWTLEGEVRVAAASLRTGNRRRDRKMREKSLAVGSYPEILFLPESLLPGEPGEGTSFTLRGHLTIRGVTLSVSIPVAMREGEGGRLHLSGETDLTWADYGVPDPSFLFLRVRPTVRVRFQTDWMPVESKPQE